MNNVYCAGGGKPPHISRWSQESKGYVLLKDGDPCGWTGERFAIADIPAADLAGLQTTEERTIAIRHADAEVRTAKPCPRCGGRVEMISQEVGS